MIKIQTQGFMEHRAAGGKAIKLQDFLEEAKSVDVITNIIVLTSICSCWVFNLLAIFRSSFCQHFYSDLNAPPNIHTFSLALISENFCFSESLEKKLLLPQVYSQPTPNRHFITFLTSLGTVDKWSSLASLRFLMTLWYFLQSQWICNCLGD